MSEAVALRRVAIKDIQRGYIPNVRSIHLLLFDLLLSPLSFKFFATPLLTSGFFTVVIQIALHSTCFPYECSSVTAFFSLFGSPVQMIIYLLFFTPLPPLFLSKSLSLSSS